MLTTPVGTSEAQARTRRTSTRRRPVSRRRPGAYGSPEPAGPTPPIVTVYRRPSGAIFHAWCGQPLQYHGRRAEQELDFYCFRCLEHVSLPEAIVYRIPMAPEGA